VWLETIFLVYILEIVFVKDQKINAEHTEVRILLADKHRLLRYSIRAVISQAKNLILAGEINPIDNIPQAVQRLQPHVLLLGMDLPQPLLPNSLEELRYLSPIVKVLALLPHEDSPVRSVLDAGAIGCFYKGESPEQLLKAINMTAQVETYLSPIYIKNLSQRQRNQHQLAFTKREFEIMRLIVSGYTDREIALALDISPRTVRYDLDSIYKKLNVSSRVEAAYKFGRLDFE
jgi:DNA-binding NarL/FixJ family response regulator